MTALPFDEKRPHHKKLNLAEIEQLAILREAHWGTLASVNADGGPYAVPIGFAYDEERGHIIFHTARRGVKIDNLARDSRVCFSIVGEAALVTEKFSATFKSLVIFGDMERIDDDDESYRAAVIFCGKFAPNATRELVSAESEEGTDMALMMHKAKEFMAMYRLIPNHISGKQRLNK